jgi:anti-sigma B factor antagonist
MIIPGIIKRGSTMVDHFAEPVDPAASAHRDGFDVRESWIDRVAVLSVCDVVDMLSAPRLIEAIRDALGKAPVGLIVDLTEVDFLASVGMSVLVAAQEAADAMSVRFGIVAEGAATSRPIRLLGIDGILVLYPTLGDALRDLRCGNDEPAPTRSP